MLQIDDKDYFEDLTPARAKEILAALRDDKEPDPGSQAGRISSEPEGGAKTLLDLGGAGGEG